MAVTLAAPVVACWPGVPRAGVSGAVGVALALAVAMAAVVSSSWRPTPPALRWRAVMCVVRRVRGASPHAVCATAVLAAQAPPPLLEDLFPRSCRPGSLGRPVGSLRILISKSLDNSGGEEGSGADAATSPHASLHTPAAHISASAMQSPASDRARSPDRYVVRLSGALAALLGRAEGAELPEDELLGRLREWGLITYPSPLLGPMLEEWADVLAAEVLTQLDPTDLAIFARVGPASRTVVVASGLPRAGTGGGALLEVEDFVGSAERLAWARDNGCPWNAGTSAVAARSGHLEVLRWAREHGCEWDADTCAEAAEAGHLEVLKWAREQGCPWVEVDEEDADDIMNCCACAAKGGHLDVLKWLREQDCPWDAWTCASAAENGHLELLKWARQHGCPWEEDIEDSAMTDCCALAAGGGFLEVLKWLREQNCPWNAVTCAEAAFGGHLEVLKWAREHGCPWVEVDEIDANDIMNCCTCAAAGGHLEVLKWLWEQNCPWVEKTCANAAAGGYLEVLEWLRHHNCPWDESTFATAAGAGHMKVLRWLREHNCPWDEVTCATPSPPGASRCCSGFGSTTAPGTIGRANSRKRKDTWSCCSGRWSTVLHLLKFGRERSRRFDEVNAALCSGGRSYSH